jgi:hypothetical protein
MRFKDFASVHGIHRLGWLKRLEKELELSQITISYSLHAFAWFLNSPDTGLLPCLVRPSQSFWITRLSRILRKVQAPFLRLFEASAATQKVWVPSLPSRLISSCPHLVHYWSCLYFALIIPRKIIFTELISYTEAGARLAEDPNIEILNIVDSMWRLSWKCTTGYSTRWTARDDTLSLITNARHE